MKVIVVANPKGGVGKSTFSSNLAGALAQQGGTVMLGDVDRQQSARAWLGLRPAQVAKIHPWEIGDDGLARPPKEASHVVLDTPAGLHGKLLDKVLKHASEVIVPLQPSLFDILATRHFLDALAEEKAIRKGALRVGIVAMRVDARTRAAQELDRFLENDRLPVIGHLRDSQIYVQLAARGLSLFDLNPATVERDLATWQPILDWLRPAPRSAALD